MANIQHNYSLKPFNTFGLDIKAKAFFSVDSPMDIKDLETIEWNHYPSKLIIGGGSNLLFLKDFDGIIIHQTYRNIRILEETDADVKVEVSAAVIWDDFVEWAVEHNYSGIENLSDIPGEVGASPVQNIGAYGVEAKDVITKVYGIYLETGKAFSFENKDCLFDYRDSIFKHSLKGKVLITSVEFVLHKEHAFNLSYGTVEQEVKALGEVNLLHIRKAIQHIRGSKLPNYQEMGNAGSFFKNPVISTKSYEQLKFQFPDIPHYSVSDDLVKIPAAWLIDQSQLKGFSIGGAAVHEKQPLVLINKNNASGDDVYKLAMHVIKTVKKNFGIELSPEVNIIG